MINSFELAYIQHIFPGGRKILQGVWSPPWLWAWS